MIGDVGVIKLNGHETSRYTEKDAKVPRSGFVALQLQAGGPMRIEFKDIAIRKIVSADTSVGSSFKAGAAKVVITPHPLLPISGGIGVPTPAKEKRGELTARAMVIENNGVRVAFVSIDALGFPSVLGDRVRKLVPRIPPENI